jgi:Uma2 family endonuclease
LQQHDVGIVVGADGPLRLRPGLVRLPNVSFVSWDRLPSRHYPKAPIPDLAVEVLSEGNTPKEMERKLGEDFQVGVRLVWLVDPDTRTVRVFTGADQSILLDTDQMLDGGDVLPGFALPLAQLFARVS